MAVVVDTDRVLERLGRQQEEERQGLYVGRNNRVLTAISSGILVVSAASSGAVLLSAPVVLVTVKILAHSSHAHLTHSSPVVPESAIAPFNTSSVSSSQPSKLGALLATTFSKSSSVSSSEKQSLNGSSTVVPPTSSEQSSTKVHFQLITPAVQLPMFATSLSYFTQLRTELDAARAAALSSGSSTQNLDEENQLQELPVSDSRGLNLLELLRASDDSNRRCGGCGKPDANWAAVEKTSLWVGLIVCEYCGGFYRGNPNFVVRSFLYDVSLFQDQSSKIYQTISSISNMQSCIVLSQHYSDSLKLYFAAPTLQTSHTHPGVVSDGLDYTYMPAGAHAIASASAAAAAAAAVVKTNTPVSAGSEAAKPAKPKPPAFQWPQGRFARMLSGRKSNPNVDMSRLGEPGQSSTTDQSIASDSGSSVLVMQRRASAAACSPASADYESVVLSMGRNAALLANAGRPAGEESRIEDQRLSAASFDGAVSVAAYSVGNESKETKNARLTTKAKMTRNIIQGLDV
ncbi:hypothetical protein HDU82_000186 [Entophlyctis luteolus]|nr:hypothetical protein HDU82_000186 [Entophlyctis luteolus]